VVLDTESVLHICAEQVFSYPHTCTETQLVSIFIHCCSQAKMSTFSGETDGWDDYRCLLLYLLLRCVLSSKSGRKFNYYCGINRLEIFRDESMWL